eukprot:5721639-Pyramimonas_sp.AAC.1
MRLGLKADQVRARVQVPHQHLPVEQQLGPPVEPPSYGMSLEILKNYFDTHGGVDAQHFQLRGDARCQGQAVLDE